MKFSEIAKKLGKGEVTENFYTEKMDWRKLKILFTNGVFICSILQGLPSSIPYGVLFTFFQQYLVEDIGPLVGGITIQSTVSVIFLYGVGAVIGEFLSGFIVDYLWKKNPRYVAIFMISFMVLGAIPLLVIFAGPPLGKAIVYGGVLFPVGLILGLPAVALRILVLNATLPETRGTAAAFGNLFGDLGNSLGPLWTSSLIVAYGGNRNKAFTVAVCFFFVAATLLTPIICFIDRDMARNKVLMQQALNYETSSNGSSEDENDPEIDELAREKKKVADSEQNLEENSPAKNEDNSISTLSDEKKRSSVIDDAPVAAYMNV